MTKNEFFDEIREKAKGLPEDKIYKAIQYYDEMIEDAKEDGKTEEETISGFDSPEKIAKDLIGDTPLPAIIKEKIKTKQKRHMSAFEIILLILGFPLWFVGLLLFGLFVGLIYFAIWLVDGLLWFGNFVVANVSVCSFAFSVMNFVTGHFLAGLFFLGFSFVLSGVSILYFILAKLITKLFGKLSKLIARGVKLIFVH